MKSTFTALVLLVTGAFYAQENQEQKKLDSIKKKEILLDEVTVAKKKK